jgi:hypothetical protein
LLSSSSQESFQISPNLNSLLPCSNTLFFPSILKWNFPARAFPFIISVKYFSDHLNMALF